MPKPPTGILLSLGLCGALWVSSAWAQTPEPLAADFKVSERSYFDFTPDIDMDARGNFVVVWSHGKQAYYGPEWDIWGRRFSSDGRPATDAFRVNDDTIGQHRPAEVAVTPDGRFVVVWHARPHNYPGGDIRARLFDSRAAPQGGDLLIASDSAGYDLFSADVAADANGNFVVVWEREIRLVRGTIQARRFSSTGTGLGEEFRVNVGDSELPFFPTVHWTPDGGFLVVWVTIEGASGQRYSSDGLSVGQPFTVHDSYARGIISRIDVAPSGQFVVAWMEFTDSNYDDVDIFARTFSANATPLSDRFQVNTAMTGPQEFPSVAMERGGEFIVVWDSPVSMGTDDWGDSIQGQRFSSTGKRVGDEFQVNTTTLYYQTRPSVAAVSGKGFVVAWTSWEDFPYISYIRGRRFGPTPAFCSQTETIACLNRGRFQVEVEWTDFAGKSGLGRRVAQGSDDSALFWFFGPNNWEVLVKVLDGCAINHRFWVFAAATTNVAYVLRVTDTETGQVREYENPLGRAADAVTDSAAFATCQ